MASDGGMEAGVIEEFIGYHGDEELESYMNKKINKNMELEKEMVRKMSHSLLIL